MDWWPWSSNAASQNVLAGSSASSLGEIVDRFRPDLKHFEEEYKALHAEPELSRRERKTSTRIADFLQGLGFTVHRDIGGYGLIAMLENGPGPTVLLRAELDALPILEQTNLSYSSKTRMKDEFDIERPVMHACGHDMHMACLMAASKLLFDAKATWNGKLLVLFQPNEEHTGGAQAMIDDGVYDQVGIPDIVLGQHSIPFPSGNVSLREGPVVAAADTIRVRIFGSLQLPANPQDGKDPILVTSKLVVRLTAEFEKKNWKDFVNLAFQEFHAGDQGADVIDSADVVLDLKTYRSTTRDQAIELIKRIVIEECKSNGLPNPPEITVSVRAPVTNNQAEATKRLQTTFEPYFGDKLSQGDPRKATEDFSLLATSHNIPYVFWFFGRVDQRLWDKAQSGNKQAELIPQNHSPLNAPVVQPTLATGTNALALAALTFLGQGQMQSMLTLS